MTWTRPFKGMARYASVTAMAAIMVTACAAPGSSAPGSATTPTAAPTAAGSPAVASPSAAGSADAACGTEAFDLVTEDVEGANPGPTAAIDQLNKEFMAKYPNVTIKRTKTSFDALQTKQPLELSGPNPPDVFQIVVPTETFANFGNAGLIVNLDDYAKKYGWVERSGPAQLYVSRFDDKGVIGSGPIYGIPQVQELVGVFYNKEKLEQLKLKVPTTWEEFLASLATAKQAGQVPIMMGIQGQGHVFAMDYNRFVPTEDINGWTFHNKEGVSFDSPGWLAAAKEYQSWATQGYFEPEFNAVEYDDAWKRFAAGEGLYLPAGSWLTGGILEAMGDKAGLFLAPPSKENPALQVQGGPGQPWAISAASKHQDCGAAYLDFMTSQRGGEILIENNVPPGFTMATLPSIPPGLYLDLIEAFQTINKSYNVSTYEGVATPTIGALLRANRQELLAGKMTPEAFVKSIQAEYEKN